MSETIQPKVIRSRSTKQIGDELEGKWRITGIKVIAAPHKGNPPWDPPRQGIYDYTVEPLIGQRMVDRARELVSERTENSLEKITNAIKSGRLDNVDPGAVILAIDRIMKQEEKDLRIIDRAERAMVSFRRL